MELRPEAGGAGDPGQRQHEEGHDRRHAGSPEGEPREVGDAFAVAAPRRQRDHHPECAERHEEIDDQIVEQRALRLAGARRQREGEIARVRDARVGQHTLQIVLYDGHQVADHDAEERKGPEDAPNHIRQVGHGREDEAQHDHGRRHLHAHGHEGSHRRGRTLVDVRRPLVEGSQRQLEGEAHEDQGQARHREGVRHDERILEAGVVEAARRAIEERHAIEEDRTREAAHQEIFETGLVAAGLGAVEGRKGI